MSLDRSILELASILRAVLVIADNFVQTMRTIPKHFSIVPDQNGYAYTYTIFDPENNSNVTRQIYLELATLLTALCKPELRDHVETRNI